MDFGMLLGIIGVIGFLGCLIWLIVRAIQWDSKWPAVLGMALCVVLFFVGVAISEPVDTADNDSKSGTEAKRDEETERDTYGLEQIEKGSKEAYEITYQYSTIYKNMLDEIDCYALVEIKNTGNIDLYLDGATFDFEDSEGKLLGTCSGIVSADPSIIAPGENGYFYCNMGSVKGTIDENTEYVFKPTVKVEESKNDIVRYDISDTSISSGGFTGQVSIIGRITNTTEEDAGLIWISCVLYREDGTPIGVYGTNITDLAAGETTTFDASSVYLSSLDFEMSDVAEYKVYACKTQYQF